MADRAAVIDTLNKFAYGYDHRKVDVMTDCFTEDATMSLTIAGGDVVGPFEGRAAVMKLMTDSLEAQTDQRRHLTTNHHFEQEDGDSARTVANLTLVSVADGKLAVLSTGVYHDLVVNDGGMWRIKERFLALDLPY